MKVLVAGANGFVGKQLTKYLTLNKFEVTGSVRGRQESIAGCNKVMTVGPIHSQTNWQIALEGQNVVVHLANRAHVMNEQSEDPLAEFRRVNVEGTLNLARQAISFGVRRFIFISSIKVNGEGEPNCIYRYDDPVAPEDDYAQSKWEAEQGLRALCDQSSMELVIIRPPLIYGSGVKGNLALLAKVIDKGLPLPLGAIKNQRDMLSLNNLIDLIKTCIEHPAATGQVFLCCDNEPVSTPQLIKLIASGREKNAHIWPVPVFILNMFASLTGKQDMLKRLTSDFRIDIQHTLDTLDWKPPFSVAESMRWAFAEK